MFMLAQNPKWIDALMNPKSPLFHVNDIQKAKIFNYLLGNFRHVGKILDQKPNRQSVGSF
jgi:hypothetical protein